MRLPGRLYQYRKIDILPVEILCFDECGQTFELGLFDLDMTLEMIFKVK